MDDAKETAIKLAKEAHDIKIKMEERRAERRNAKEQQNE